MISNIADAQPNRAPLNDRIRQARLRQKITRAELAKRVGVVPSAVAQWEHPTGTTPSVSNLIAIARIADVAFEWLATGRGHARLQGFAEEFALSADAIAMDLFEEEVLAIARRIPHKHRNAWLHYLQIVYSEGLRPKGQ